MTAVWRYDGEIQWVGERKGLELPDKADWGYIYLSVGRRMDGMGWDGLFERVEVVGCPDLDLYAGKLMGGADPGQE